MFDIQYEGRFGKKEEKIEELESILRGIYDKLNPELDVIFHWAIARDVLMHFKYDKEISEKSLKSPIPKKEIWDKVEEILYDPCFETVNMPEDQYNEEKRKRNNLVSVGNEIAIMVMQIDNVIEEISSKLYNVMFPEKRAANCLFKEGIEEIGVDNEISKMMITLRGVRNKFCHSYAFNKVFLEMSVGKIHFIKRAVFKMYKTAIKFVYMYKIIEDLKRPGRYVRSYKIPENRKAQKLLYIKGL